MPSTRIAAVRGAVSVAANTAPDLLEATSRLLTALVEANGIERSAIVSALFTATPDLDADFPAHAARRLGWNGVPLLCAREIDVPGAMPRVVRVMLTVMVDEATELRAVYLDGAAVLRPDLHPATEPGEAPASRAAEKTIALAIVGLGQIGGSIGLGLARAGSWRRTGFDVDPQVLAAARAAGAVDEIATSLETACAGADLVVIATPVDTIPQLVDCAAAAMRSGAVLADTGSVRSPIEPALERAAARGMVAVGFHPLAGNEGRGFGAARADLFRDAPFAVTTRGGDVPRAVESLVQDLGGRVRVVDPVEHDHALSRTSHLPYLLACAIRDLGRSGAAEDLAGPGFRGMIRLAASDPRMAQAFCRANAREIAVAWVELRAAVDREVESLEGGAT